MMERRRFVLVGNFQMPILLSNAASGNLYLAILNFDDLIGIAGVAIFILSERNC